MLKTIYRICDLRDGGTKIPQITKRHCFLNFVEVFGTEHLTIIADNTRPQTIDFLSRYTGAIVQTSLGNSGSFLRALDLALQYGDDNAVYLVEDDYLHMPGGPKFLAEGLTRADYVSLYDHADKYRQPSPNPLVCDGGENTKVILTESSHWKYTNSTTMTFAVTVKTLKADQQVFRQFCTRPVPLDYFIFKTLAETGRSIVTPIPGRSTHCDHYPSPFFFKSDFPAGRAAPGSDKGRRTTLPPLGITA